MHALDWLKILISALDGVKMWIQRKSWTNQMKTSKLEIDQTQLKINELSPKY